MKRLLVFLVAALVAVSTSAVAADKVLRIPFSTAFSGPYVAFGERLWRGGNIAVDEITAAGGVRGGYKMEFYKVDTRGIDVAPFMADFKRICKDDNNKIMLGNMSSKTLFAIYEVAKQCNMPLFAATSGANWVFPDHGKWVFRYLQVPKLVLPVLYQKLQEKLGAKTVALSYTIDDDFTFFNAKLAREVLEKQGYEIVADLGTKLKEVNYASPVAAVRVARPDVVILSHQPDDGGKFVLQLRDRGIDAQVSDTGYTVVGRDYWDLSKGKGIGSIGSSLYAPSDPRPIVQNYVKKWRAVTGKQDRDPDPYETSTYDAVYVMAHVINTAKSLNRKDLADAFLAIKDMETVSGLISYRKEDLPDVYRSEPVLVQLGENGKMLRWGN